MNEASTTITQISMTPFPPNLLKNKSKATKCKNVASHALSRVTQGDHEEIREIKSSNLQ